MSRGYLQLLAVAGIARLHNYFGVDGDCRASLFRRGGRLRTAARDGASLAQSTFDADDEKWRKRS